MSHADLRRYIRTYDQDLDPQLCQQMIGSFAGLERFQLRNGRGVREIAEFLRLPWHDDMLAPAEHARAKGFISTPSYSQVVQPVNQKAVGRWRAYERHLAPVIPRLQPYLQRWDYSDR